MCVRLSHQLQQTPKVVLYWAAGSELPPFVNFSRKPVSCLPIVREKCWPSTRRTCLVLLPIGRLFTSAEVHWLSWPRLKISGWPPTTWATSPTGLRPRECRNVLTPTSLLRPRQQNKRPHMTGWRQAKVCGLHLPEHWHAPSREHFPSSLPPFASCAIWRPSAA